MRQIIDSDELTRITNTARVAAPVHTSNFIFRPTEVAWPAGRRAGRAEEGGLGAEGGGGSGPAGPAGQPWWRREERSAGPDLRHTPDLTWHAPAQRRQTRTPGRGPTCGLTRRPASTGSCATVRAGSGIGRAEEGREAQPAGRTREKGGAAWPVTERRKERRPSLGSGRRRRRRCRRRCRCYRRCRQWQK